MNQLLAQASQALVLADAGTGALASSGVHRRTSGVWVRGLAADVAAPRAAAARAGPARPAAPVEAERPW